MQPETPEAEPDEAGRLNFIETFLRMRGDHQTLLAVDALVLREDLDDQAMRLELQQIIQGVMHGKR